MPRNVYDIGRNLFLIAFAIAVLASFVVAWNAEPNARLTYQIQSPGAAAVLVDRCGADDAREYFYRRGPQGKWFNIDLCFKVVSRNQVKFIPYASEEDGLSWIEFKYSPQVDVYTKTVARNFTLPLTDHAAALDIWHAAKRQARLARLAELAARLALVGVACWLAVWLGRRTLAIVRTRRARRLL